MSNVLHCKIYKMKGTKTPIASTAAFSVVLVSMICVISGCNSSGSYYQSAGYFHKV